jgi:hypothetical protein
MGIFKKKASKNAVSFQGKVAVKPLNYPAKVILGWAKAIEGNQDILAWLAQNGYEELSICYWALVLKDDARRWLSQNGFAHLLAFVNACESNDQAKMWLKNNKFDTLYNMAQAVDGEEENIAWMMKNTSQEMIVLTQAIKRLKDDIETNHNDVHKFGMD